MHSNLHHYFRLSAFAHRVSLYFILVTMLTTAASTSVLAQKPPSQQQPTSQITARTSSQPVSTAPKAAKTAAPTQPSFRWPGEEFYYSVRINGAEAMRAGVRVGQVRVQNSRFYVPISGTAQSTGFFHSIYPLDDRADTFFDPQTFLPLRSEKTFHEKGQTRSYFVDYYQSSYLARVEKMRKNRTIQTRHAIPSTTHDMLTWLYELRTAPPYEIGQKFSFFVYDGWSLSRIDFTVRAKEDVYTPMGWFKGWKLDFRREVLHVTTGRPVPPSKDPAPPILKVRESGRHSGNFWVSRDENRLPIKLKINTILGAGEAVLIKYQPAVRPAQ